MSSSTNKMSVLQLTILTAVNMMGSGIIMLPTKLAEVGSLSIVSWLITALGSMALAYAFAKCGMYSRKGGGMGGFAEYSFGKAGNFMANYTYGVSLLIANIAIAISAVGYGAAFLNAQLTPVSTALFTIAVLWIATVLNFGGAKLTGRISSFTVWGVIAPVIVISTAGWYFFSGDLYTQNWNIHNLPFGEAATSSIAMTLWAFLGLESACANADAVENPEKNVPIAVLGGTLGVAAIYIVSTNIMFGIVPAANLAESSAPFGMVFSSMFNPSIGKLVMGLMVLSCFGSLLGWQFTIANVFKGSSDEGYFPAIFSKVTAKNAPVVGMIVITATQSLMSLMTISPTLSKQFEALVNLAVVTNIIPYLLSMGAAIVILKAAQRGGKELTITTILATVGSIYSLYALYASGFEAMTYGSIVTFAGWTLYGFISDKFDLASNKKP
ncbi:putrescine-ornithine antiporter [Dichelobacter nodosus]|uniref:Putrescine transporter PotE n=1 Tax=Dichelobacter nodosus (strain VCS1703A) TaxID=246195 RepID=A5EWZ4_DICNV|nr:putrescine-ornithine antiporter [Dichelobacter nodosus]ABQ13265.1 Amino acid transporter superfamily [Dichelobacter nodosus VCS1703A]AXM44966.1 putrescine-ornithine antiporter [Dichelobacter nodosus]KNZ39662.1 putrescine transporter [Dichelobacter nodosus]TGA65812.1 putrescine-ornithine antiporter [Dichelobacter nodosus]